MTPGSFAAAALLGDEKPWTDILRALGATEGVAQGRRAASAVDVPAAAIGFECRLAAIRSRIDFGMLVLAADAISAGRSANGAPGISGFLRRWTTGDGPLAEESPYAMFEMDAADRGGATPSVFFRLRTAREAAAVGVGRTEAEHRDCLHAAALDGLRASGADCGEALQAGIAQAFASLGPDGRVLHVGRMLGRAGQVRLFVSLPHAEMRSFLDAVGLARIVDSAAEIERRYGLGRARVELQVEIGPGASERVGVEFPLHHPVAVTRLEGFRSLFAALAADGLCAPEKAAALLAWPGFRVSAKPLAAAPAGLMCALSHVKIAIQPGRPPSAKCYFSASGARC